MKISYRVHAVRRMFEREISEAEVRRVPVYEPDPALWDDGFKRRRP